MGPPNSTWRHIIDQAAQQPEILKESDTIKNVQNILQTNVSVCTSLGHGFLSQMSRIYADMLNFYRQARSTLPPSPLFCPPGPPPAHLAGDFHASLLCSNCQEVSGRFAVKRGQRG